MDFKNMFWESICLYKIQNTDDKLFHMDESQT